MPRSSNRVPPRRRAVLAVVVSTTLMLTGCSSTSESSATDGEMSPATDGEIDGEFCASGTIEVGIAAAKTGAYSFFDTPASNAVSLALEEANEASTLGDCRFEVTWQDTGSDPAVAGQIAQSLIGDGAEILITPSDFDAGIVAAQAGQDAGLLTISPAASSADFPVAVGDLMFIGNVSTEVIGDAQARLAADKGWTSAYYLLNNSFNYYESLQQVFAEESGTEELGVTQATNGQTDFGSAVSNIRSATGGSPDAVIWGGTYFPDVAAFVKQVRSSGVEIPILGDITWVSPNFAESVGTANLEEVYYLTPGFGGEGGSQEVKAFEAAYEAKYGEIPPNANAIAGYQVAQAVIAALESAQSTDGTVLADALRGQEEQPVAGSTIQRWKDGYSIRSIDVVAFNDDGIPILERTVNGE